MNSKYRKYITYTAAVGVLTLSSVLGGCTKESSSEAGDATPSEVNVIQAVPETIAQLGLNGQVLPGLNDINLPDAEPAPEYLRIGCAMRSSRDCSSVSWTWGSWTMMSLRIISER